jgi:hypothetical protein
MDIKVLNCPDKDFKPYVIRAAHFFAKELIPNTRIRNNCLTTIRFDSTIVNYGSCGVEEYNTKNEPREFLIEIHPGIGAKNILATLAHEMVHIKQYIQHETNDELSMWKGKKVDSDSIDYWDHPWEIDAHGREIGLFTKFAVQEFLWEVFDGFKNPNVPIVSVPIKWKKIK